MRRPPDNKRGWFVSLTVLVEMECGISYVATECLATTFFRLLYTKEETTNLYSRELTLTSHYGPYHSYIVGA